MRISIDTTERFVAVEGRTLTAGEFNFLVECFDNIIANDIATQSTPIREIVLDKLLVDNPKKIPSQA